MEKILDTNVLLRYLAQDDPGQSRRAHSMIAETIARGDRCATFDRALKRSELFRV
jgi:predicted nucleic-acid-binding protein